MLSLRLALFSALIPACLTSGLPDKLGSKRSLKRLSDSTTPRGLDSRAAPAGWSLFITPDNDGGGCYMDYPDRALPDLALQFGEAASLATCLNACAGKGYPWAAVEFYDQCFCSASKPQLWSAPAADCSTRCKSGETCGGVWRMNVYNNPPQSTNLVAVPSTAKTGQWEHLGCFRDNVRRVLNGWSHNDDGMTVLTCLSACGSNGWTMAGLEFGRECYCGNSYDTMQLPDSSCNVDCMGGGGTCGGFWAMNMYKYAESDVTAVSTSSSSASNQWAYQGCYQDGPSRVLSYSTVDDLMTPSKCLAHCQDRGYTLGGVEFGRECYCGNTLNGGGTIGEASCGASCGGGGTGCGGSYAISLFSLGGTAVASAASTASPTSVPASVPSGWTYLYCASDGPSRALSTSMDGRDMTPTKCLNYCSSQGYTFGGMESSTECFCGNSLQNGQGYQVGESECGGKCSGDATSTCGGVWRLSLYSTLSGSALSSAASGTPVVSSSTTGASAGRPTASPSAAATAAPSNPGSFTISDHIPGTNDNKAVWAHHMVGNTWSYDYNTWRDDISLAQTAGIDGFVLNIGQDYWQPDRVKDAYNAANDMGFKMMLSLDMVEIKCGDWSQGPLLQYYLGNYIFHPAAAKYNGKSMLTTFGGEGCTFARANVTDGWHAIMSQYRDQIFFIPAFNTDPAGLSGFDIDGEVSWGNAWPARGTNSETSRDKYFMQNLVGRAYMATISPIFSTTLAYKNWIWRSDNWLHTQRWDLILGMRDKIDHVELLTWNDYGESSYLGPIRADRPPGSEYFANDNFPHTDILSLQAFYSAAWKSGAYPTITKDQIWAMARPHPAMANANGAPPDNRDQTDDNFYIQVHLTGAATVTLCASSDCASQQGQPGVNRFAKSLSAGQTVYAKVERNGQKTAEVSWNTPFDGNPDRYNYNYWIKSS